MLKRLKRSTAAIWGNVYLAIRSRILPVGLQTSRYVAGARGLWSGLAFYMFAAMSLRNPENQKWPLAAVTPTLFMYSPGGLLFGVAYSVSSAGQRAFDAARCWTFRRERYPLLDQMRQLHGTTAEQRAIKMQWTAQLEFTKARDNPVQSLYSFWSDNLLHIWSFIQPWWPIRRFR